MVRLFLLSVLFLTGCSQSAFVRTIYGVRKSKIESTTSISEWVQKHGFSKAKVYTLDPEFFFESVIHGYNSSFRIFTKKGEFLSVGYSDDGQFFCPRDFDDYIRKLPHYAQLVPKPGNYLTRKKSTPGNPDSTITIYPNLSELNTMIRELNGDKATIPMDYFTEYILVMPFALWKGDRLQVKELKKYYNAAIDNDNKAVRFQVVLLNIDKQEWWGEEWNRKINISHK